MPTVFASNRTILRASLLLPGVSALLLMTAGPGHTPSSTYAAISALAIGMGGIVWTTWRHAQPVASLRQELYDINHSPVGATGSSWQRWVAAGDRSDARGRALAGFGLSTAITAVIVAAWFA